MDGRPKRATAARARVALGLGAALAVLAAASCQRGGPPPAIVLVTVDTLRADHVGLYGYGRATTPNIDRWFSAKGRVHEKSWSTEAATTPSVISLLTGLQPQQHRVRMLVQLVPKSLRLLPEMLPKRWETAAFVSNMMLTDEASGLASHFGHFDDFVDETERHRANSFERNAERTTDAVLDWLGRRKSDDRPLFLWIHYMDPHGPYHAPDTWKRTFHHDSPLPIDIDRVPDYEREPGVTDGLAYVDAYDEEIAYLDSQVGRLLAAIDARFGEDRALVVLTADHGESMMDHEDWFRHATSVYEEMVRVPLMLRGPGVRPGRSALPTSGVDVAPTLLKAAGLPLPPDVPNVDLRDDDGLVPGRIVFTEASFNAREGGPQWRAAIQSGTKWMIGVRPGNCEETRRRYDLAKDPGELVIEPWTGEGEAPATLLKRCREDPDPAGKPVDWNFGQGLKGPKSPPMSDQRQKESLRGLGYLDD